jgi:hypothetical protein
MEDTFRDQLAHGVSIAPNGRRGRICAGLRLFISSASPTGILMASAHIGSIAGKAPVGASG